MFSLSLYLSGLLVLAVFAVLAWPVSILKKDVSIVDSMWSLFFVVAAAAYYLLVPEPSVRAACMLVFVAVWGLRLSGYITWRNWGEGEDYRYAAMRERNDPGFWFKSLYIVFLLQAAIAWVVSLPLMGAITGRTPLGWLDAAGLLVFGAGLFFESVGDYQLARFKADPANKGQVMDKGLWRYTRHPNYFGDFCVWWGFYLIALSAGAWWSIIGPLVMTYALLKFSGVALLEKDISERRPEYAEYKKRTNAFFPWKPRSVEVGS
jgi:steroid 5-alpha reductase family enzyme